MRRLKKNFNMVSFRTISREIFYFLSVLMVVFVILEVIWPNIILAYLNLNWLLAVWLIFGLIILSKK